MRVHFSDATLQRQCGVMRRARETNGGNGGPDGLTESTGHAREKQEDAGEAQRPRATRALKAPHCVCQRNEDKIQKRGEGSRNFLSGWLKPCRRLPTRIRKGNLRWVVLFGTTGRCPCLSRIGPSITRRLIPCGENPSILLRDRYLVTLSKRNR